MRVLFITRKYPPQIGGMESFAFGLINNIACDKEVIALNKSQINLIWWLPYAMILSLIKAPQADYVHLCDGLLAPLGLMIKKVYHKPVSVTVHGLDVTYHNWLYQNINVRCLKYLDKIICVSNSTKQDCLDKNIPEKKLFVIPNGINIDKINNEKRITNNEKRILLTVGRLVKRKGIAWFIENIMPKLDQDFEYWVIGRGPEEEKIKKIIQINNLQDRVKLLGFVENEKLKDYYTQADAFLMPNIEVEGDREGFGIVALEAGVHGLPVLAADLEGIRDVIKNGVNGYLIAPENAPAWINKIQKKEYNNINKDKIHQYINNNFNWKIISDKYLKILYE